MYPYEEKKGNNPTSGLIMLVLSLFVFISCLVLGKVPIKTKNVVFFSNKYLPP